MNNNQLCPICNSKLKFYGKGMLRKEISDTDFYLCKKCNTFYRKTTPSLLREHFDIISYIQLSNEKNFWDARKNFFIYLWRLIEKYRDNKNRLKYLDVGCAYGHLMEVIQKENESGIIEGLEINPTLRTYLANKGFKVYSNLSEINEQNQYNVIAFIDSLYYFDDPNKILEQTYSLLTKGGLLILRSTNRCWLLRMKNLFKKEKRCDSLGDATISYSLKSIKKLFQKHNLSIVKVIYQEKGKKMPLKKRFIYSLLYLLTLLSFKQIPLSPGLIIIAKK